MHRGIYATFTGAPTRGARLWAAVLSVGPGAVLSYETAAELHGLADYMSNPIHVTVPHDRHVGPPQGVSLHRSRRPVEVTQRDAYPPLTTVEETVLDLTQTSKTFDDVCGWVTRAIARELTDESRLRQAMGNRPRLGWRADLHELIIAAAGGDHSVLEFRYHRDVEQAHGLPAAVRQVPFTGPGGRRGRRDRVYEEYGVVIELGWRTQPRMSGRTRPGTTPPPRKESSRSGTAGRMSRSSHARPPPRWPGCSACTAGRDSPAPARPAARSGWSPEDGH